MHVFKALQFTSCIFQTLCEDIGNAMEGVETSDTFMTPLGTEVGPENAVAIINRYGLILLNLYYLIILIY